MTHPGTRLLLVRHAELDCAHNGSALLCGSHDAPLSPAGRAQIERLRQRLAASFEIAAAYSSPLRRALDTAQAAPHAVRDRIRLLRSIAEIHCGTVEGLPLDEVRRNFPEVWARNESQSDENFCWPGGESYRGFRRRILRAVCGIAALHAGRTALVFTHAGVVNQVLGTLAGQSPAVWHNFRPGFTGITELLWNGDTGRVIRFDDRAHLEGG